MIEKLWFLALGGKEKRLSIHLSSYLSNKSCLVKVIMDCSIYLRKSCNVAKIKHQSHRNLQKKKTKTNLSGNIRQRNCTNKSVQLSIRIWSSRSILSWFTSLLSIVKRKEVSEEWETRSVYRIVFGCFSSCAPFCSFRFLLLSVVLLFSIILLVSVFCWGFFGILNAKIYEQWLGIKYSNLIALIPKHISTCRYVARNTWLEEFGVTTK